MNKTEIEEAIKKIDLADLRTISIDELESYLKPLFTGFKINAPIIDKGFYIYRGRICEKPCNVRELSYPPAENIEEYGRINDIGESFFYGSTAYGVPFFELGCKVGQRIAIAVWKSNSTMLLNHTGFTEECKEILNSKRALNTLHNFLKDTSGFGQLNNFVYSYLASKFVQSVETGKEYKYKITIAIGRRLLKGELFNGILYPTIAMSANADNVVLKTDYFDKNMHFVNVKYVEVTERKGTVYEAKVLDTATKLDGEGNLIWSGRNLQWTLRNKGDEVVMKAEGGIWVGYDRNGNRINPE